MLTSPRLDEMRENDWNLNIPRYVNTFEEDEPVDIAAVARELESTGFGYAGYEQDHSRLLPVYWG